MKALESLDRRDRRLLLAIALLVATTVVLLALVHPQQQEDSYVPSTYSSTPHGAKAAYLLLASLGYREERSTSLTSVADSADEHTVLILAQPSRRPSHEEIAAVERVLARGGRVLAAGALAARALPDENLDNRSTAELVRGLCEAEPVNFSAMSSGGKVLMRGVYVLWKLDKPSQRAVFLCGGKGAVVSYSAGKGTAVWWASASPLENRDIASHGSLELLLNSLALRQGDHIVWDESLHEAPPAAWNPLQDRIVVILLAQLTGVALLLILARGRRSGPLRPLPPLVRAAPLEFVRSLGGLYRSSGSNDVPVTIAYERFRSRLAQRWGVAGAQSADAATLAATLSTRFGISDPALGADLEACEGAGRLSNLTPRQALTLVRALARYGELLAHRAESSTTAVSFSTNERGNLGPQHSDSSGNSPRRRTA